MSRQPEAWLTSSSLHLYNALTDDCDVIQVLTEHRALASQDPVLSLIYRRLDSSDLQSPHHIRRIIVEEAEERETDHFFACAETDPRPGGYEDLITGLKDTYNGSGLMTLADFGERPEDCEALPLTAVWKDDHLCKESNGRMLSPQTSCSSEVTQVRAKSGLKPLAARVKELMHAAGGKASYQSLAEGLISEFEHTDSSSNRERTVKNIKRRAYDAINVMTAVGLLTRQDETLSLSLPKEHSDLLLIRDRISIKRTRLKRMSSTYQLLKSLLSRNEKHYSEPSIRVPLPYIVLATPDRTGTTVCLTVGAD